MWLPPAPAGPVLEWQFSGDTSMLLVARMVSLVSTLWKGIKNKEAGGKEKERSYKKMQLVHVSLKEGNKC